MPIQYYGQPLVYTNLKYVTNPIASNLNERFVIYNSNQQQYDIERNVFFHR